MIQRDFNIKNELNELHTVVEQLESFAHLVSLPLKTVLDFNLALEELVTNVIFYGYKGDGAGEINIKFFYSTVKSIFSVQITDFAPEFNPLKRDLSTNLSTDVEEREIGGLGIHFVKKLIDKVDYKRVNGCNIITLSTDLKKQ